MKVIIVRVGDLKRFPPSVSLANVLVDLGYQVIICTTLDSKGIETSLPKSVVIEYVDCIYSMLSLPERAINYIGLKKSLFAAIYKYYDKDSLIWVEADVTIKHLAYEIDNLNFILRLDELNEGLYYTGRFKKLKYDAKRIGNAALVVVVPEYNRAHITKTWWGLNELPAILPNKPYVSTKMSGLFEFTETTRNVLSELDGKKIVIYQGIMHKERPILPFIRAIESMDDFVTLIVSDKKWILDREYRNCYFVDFIAPPFHLELTKKAYIGIIAYRPGFALSSPLNTLYCAPNKIFEYGMFGLPIISNDLPGLKYLYGKYNCGIAVDIKSKRSICKALEKIDSNYELYSRNIKKLNDDVDMKENIDRIIKTALIRRRKKGNIS